MGKSKKEDLNQILIGHLNTIHDTLQLFDRTPLPTQDTVTWKDVLQLSDHLSKQATIVGMLWSGEPPKAAAVKEAMESYFNALQGFLLHCHGSTVGAGPTLSSNIHSSVKQIVDTSFRLLQGSVSLYDGSYEKDRKPSVPQLAGAVWEACAALKKVPSTNIMAIGRAMTQVAASVKDVLREMNELKPARDDDDVSPDANNPDDDDDDGIIDDGDIGDGLSPEEMKVAKVTADVVSETLVTIKELIRTITGMIKLEHPKDNSQFVDSLEKILKLCQGIGIEIDELGACVYPPQETNSMKGNAERIVSKVREIEDEVERFKSPSEGFSGACRRLRSLIKRMEDELEKGSDDEVVVGMQNVTRTS